MLNRRVAVELLIADETAYMDNGDIESLLEEFLRHGFGGYNNYTDAQLRAELKARNLVVDNLADW